MPLVEELDLEAMVNRQLHAHMERIAAMEALEDVDEDEESEDEEETPVRPRKGKAVAAATPETEEEEEEEEEEDEPEEEEEEEPEAEADDEEDEDEEAAEEEEEEEGDAPTVSGEFPVISASEENETVTVHANGKRTKMYVGEGVDVEYDDLGAGVVVNLEAIQDEDEDWVITSFAISGAEPEKPKRRVRKK